MRRVDIWQCCPDKTPRGFARYRRDSRARLVRTRTQETMNVPLWQAIAVNDALGTERALRRGAEVDYRGAGGLTPLLAAAERGALPIAALLLQHRASLGRNRGGTAPPAGSPELFVNTRSTSGCPKLRPASAKCTARRQPYGTGLVLYVRRERRPGGRPRPHAADARCVLSQQRAGRRAARGARLATLSL